jgi:hypothetical protein
LLGAGSTQPLHNSQSFDFLKLYWLFLDNTPDRTPISARIDVTPEMHDELLAGKH